MEDIEEKNETVLRDNRDKKVKWIRVMVHLLKDDTGKSENHWSLYLCLENPRSSSVRMNMAGGRGTRGTLVLKPLNHNSSHKQVRRYDYGTTAAGVTVGTIYKLVHDENLRRFSFHGSGSGCRFWW